MRKLAWIAVGVVCGCGVSAYWLDSWWLLLLGGIAAVCGVVCCVLKSKAGRWAAFALFGMVASLVWCFAFDGFYLSDVRKLDGQVVQSAVEITDYSTRTDYGVTADGKILLNGKAYRARIYLYDDEALNPGDRVEGELRLRYTARGGLDEMTYHQGKGIFLLGYFRDEVVVSGGDFPYMKYFAANLRRDIQNILDEIFPADTVAFARALLLGDSSLLTYKDNTDLAVSGIRHIVAVSGLHVSILFSVLFVLFGRNRILTPLIGLPLLAAFAALAGFTPSVSRACIMQGLMLLSLSIDKEYDGPTALAFSVLVILGVNPLTVTSVSFQLSVGCMVGILGFSDKIRRWLLDKKRLGPAKGKSIKARLTRWFCGGISVTLGAMIVTTPLCAWYFGMVSLVGVFTNLLCLWVVTALFCCVMAACIAGAILPAVGNVIAWVTSWLIRYIQLVSGGMADIPFAAVYTESIYIMIWLIFVYVLLVVFALIKRRHPAVMLGCVAAGLCVAVFFSWLEPKMDDYRVTVLDVGEGQCILLQTDGHHYLVDCGGDSAEDAADLAAQTLLSQGVRSLDGVIVTHYDADHAGGVEALLSRIPADAVYLPRVEDVGQTRSKLESMELNITWVDFEQTLLLDQVPITMFGGKEGASDNESSLCVLFQPESCDILIMADRGAAGERALMAQTQLPELEVLVVGHHGSNTSTCLELLHQTAPKVAVISVGTDNSYGHPAPQVLERLKLYNCRILRTDLQGNIIIRG